LPEHSTIVIYLSRHDNPPLWLSYKIVFFDGLLKDKPASPILSQEIVPLYPIIQRHKAHLDRRQLSLSVAYLVHNRIVIGILKHALAFAASTIIEQALVSLPDHWYPWKQYKNGAVLSVAGTGHMPQYRNFYHGGKKRCSKVLASTRREILSRLYRLCLKCLSGMSVLLPHRLYRSLSAMNLFPSKIILFLSMSSHDRITNWYPIVGEFYWLEDRGAQSAKLGGKSLSPTSGAAIHEALFDLRKPSAQPSSDFYSKRPLVI